MLSPVGSCYFTTEYHISSALTGRSPMFCPNGPCSSITTHFYEVFSFYVSTAGFYIITTTSKSNTYGLLYHSAFDATSPRENLISADDNNAGDQQFAVAKHLQLGTRYYIVVTTSRDDEMSRFVLNFFCSGTIWFV